jgi:hypothetical protein
MSYDPQVEVVKVKEGSNMGKKIKPRSLVRDVPRIGE